MVSKYLGMLVCAFIGHADEQTSLRLGKITPEELKATRCKRCGRMRVPTSQFTGLDDKS
jgi:uncharacterized OB-fold protein